MKTLKILMLVFLLCAVDGHSAVINPRSAGVVNNVKEFGAKGDGVTDDTLAIKAAILSLRSTGGKVFFPGGIYLVGHPSAGTGGYLDNYFIPLVSNLTLEGLGAESVIKVKDSFLSNVKDDTSNAHILAGKRLKNVAIRNLTFDGNGKNNLTPAGHLRNAVFISLDADNITIENNVFINCAGHNMLATSGKGALVQNNRLQNGGHYVGTSIENRHNPDFSFMYIASNDSVVKGNIIEQQDPDIALRGYTGGIEIHGSNTVVTGNTVRGCNPAVYIANDTNSTTIDVSQNSFEKCIRGVVIWNTDFSMKDVAITNNKISLYRPSFRVADVAYGIGQDNGSARVYSRDLANGGCVEDLVIRGNAITSVSSPQTPAIQGIRLHSIKRGVIESNTIEGLSDIGIAFSGSPWGISDLTVRFNRIIDCGSAQPSLSSKAAIYIATDGAAEKPARDYFIKNILIEKNEFGTTHVETLDKEGKIVGNHSKGDMLAGIVLAGYNNHSKVENLMIRENGYTNLIWNIIGITNSGITSAPDVIFSTDKPLQNRQMFGNEIVQYADGSKFKCTRQGYLSGKSGRISGKEGSAAVECDNSNGLRVGMYIEISGAGKAGANLYTFIRAIEDNRLMLTDGIGKTGGVIGATYSIMQPVLIAL